MANFHDNNHNINNHSLFDVVCFLWILLLLELDYIIITSLNLCKADRAYPVLDDAVEIAV